MYPIYIHGLGQSSASWMKTIEKIGLTEQSKFPDLIEICHDNQITYKNLYNNFSKFCSELDEPLDLVGLSLGGVLALNYAVENPKKVNSLILIGTQYKMPKALLCFQNVLFQCMPKSMFQQTGFGKNDFIQLCKSMMNLDFTDSLQEIQCPVLIVCGNRDFANKKAAVKLNHLIKDAELEIIHDCGHEVNVEAPGKLAEIIRTFYHQIQQTVI